MNDLRKITFKERFLAGLTQLLVYIGAIIFFFIVFKIKEIFGVVSNICNILSPVIMGIAFAYILNPMVRFYEKKLDKLVDMIPKKSKKAKKNGGHRKHTMRMPAIAISLLIVLLVLGVLIRFMVPEIVYNIQIMRNTIPAQVRAAAKDLQVIIDDNEFASDMLNEVSAEVTNFFTNWAKTDLINQLSTLITGVMGVFSGLLNCIIGLIVAVYVLSSKESFSRQFHKLTAAFLNEKQERVVLDIVHQSDKIFGGFITGKLVDSVIVGILCFIGMWILRLPYAPLVSVIVGITNIIPFFGPYIGAIPSTILILLTSPTKGVIFLVFIIILQQIDGNIIGPKILGESTGLSPFWVIFAILLGGGLFGIVGMLIGVPTFGVIYYLIKTYVNFRLARKKELKKAEKSPASQS